MNDALDNFCSGSYGARRFSDAMPDKFNRLVREHGAETKKQLERNAWLRK